MSISKSFSDLERMERDELIAEHDALAQNTAVGTSYYLDAIRHKSLKNYSTRMDQMTRRIYLLTFIVTLSTIVNLILFILPAYT